VSDIFLSYAREDLELAKALASEPAARGWSVWWDRTIKRGQIFDRVIQAALDEAKCVIVLWSRHSVKSEWVTDEAREGREKEKLIPALLDDVVMPLGFRSRHAANLIGWQGALPHAGFEELAGAVEEILVAPAPQPVRASAAAVPAAIIQPAAPARFTTGETRLNPKDGLTYVWIPPGKFIMGCSPGDGECFSNNESPRHEVTITRGFWLGQTPVTEAAYSRFLKATGKYAESASADLPVVNVSCDDAQKYCEWAGLRLPTEAEWEYAARGGTAGARYSNLDDIAWYRQNSGGKQHSVRSKQPNDWGLYDMLGNVWEWVADWFEYYEAEAVEDPTGPSDGVNRVRRGGSWSDDPKSVRASYRFAVESSYRSLNFGFRGAGS
jgi:formylglycine-generating enzyme required for sulfatase activity